MLTNGPVYRKVADLMDVEIKAQFTGGAGAWSRAIAVGLKALREARNARYGS